MTTTQHLHFTNPEALEEWIATKRIFARRSGELADRADQPERKAALNSAAAEHAREAQIGQFALDLHRKDSASGVIA